MIGEQIVKDNRYGHINSIGKAVPEGSEICIVYGFNDLLAESLLDVITFIK